MKNFIDFLKEDFVPPYSESFFIESLEKDLKEGRDDSFEVLQHHPNASERNSIINVLKEAGGLPSYMSEEVIEEGNSNGKTVVVNHGVVKQFGKTLKMLDGSKIPVGDQSDEEDSINPVGNVMKVNKYQRLVLLKRGWQDYMPIFKEIGDGKIERLGIDPRDWGNEEYNSNNGYNRGWGRETYLFKRKNNGEKDIPLVGSDEIQRYISKGYKVFEPEIISKKASNKNGEESYKHLKIDVTELDDYLNDGWEKGIKHVDNYFESFSIRTDNGKLGKVGNMSLTPGPDGSCPSDVPCKDICYAKACYNQYIDCKEAWDKNFKLIKEHLDWLVPDMDIFFYTHPKMKMFRWHVSGDIISAEHLLAINKIAMNHRDVKFWIYTKNLEAISGFSPASNLVVIVSAWNDWKMSTIDGNDETHSGKGGLHRQFPVAYFDDWNHKNLIPSDENAFICPCADDTVRKDEKSGKTLKDKKGKPIKDSAEDLRCLTCKTHGRKGGDGESHPCYMLKPGESVIFRKH